VVWAYYWVKAEQQQAEIVTNGMLRGAGGGRGGITLEVGGATYFVALKK